MQAYKIDPKRIYLTGLSMGGYGTWATAIEYPERFAAIAPICGGGDPKRADRLKSTPTWAIHGEKDKAVSVEKSIAMIDAMRQAGAVEARLTLHPDAGHDSWTRTYDDPAFYDWLLKHTRN